MRTENRGFRFHIGNQGSHKARPATAPFDFAIKNGFDSFEWYSDPVRQGWQETDFDTAARQRLKTLAGASGLRLSLHSPNHANFLEPEGIALGMRSIAFAADAGVAVVNIHLLPWKGIAAYADAVTPMLLHAVARGVRISIENIPETAPDDFNDLFTRLNRLAELKGNIGMCLDMGHANLHPTTHNDYLRYVDQLDSHVPIIHWHAHENRGTGDHHLPLFTGPAAEDDSGVRGLVRRLAERGFNGSVVFECWPERTELLVKAREKLRAIIAELG
jgi:sugar phosphate isomerase/epimerase